MTDTPPLSIDIPPPERTELEERAWAIAERGTNWVADQTKGKTPRWDDIHPAHQLGTVMQALTYLGFQAAIDDPMRGSH